MSSGKSKGSSKYTLKGPSAVPGKPDAAHEAEYFSDFKIKGSVLDMVLREDEEDENEEVGAYFCYAFGIYFYEK